jgi:dTDP-4-dehydrorhamnose reductase
VRILITGASGMLGTDVCAAASQDDLGVVALTHADLDITDPDAVSSTIIDVQPDVVLNLAAYTDVDGAERETASAQAVNGVGAGNVARAAAQAGAWLVHVSSDYVFDGAKRSPYVESDPTGPLSVYGASKLAGEQAVAREAPASHTTVRTSWLFGCHGRCFPATMLRLASERDRLTVVDDQVGCPTFTAHLARALLEIAADRELRAELTGVVHLTAAGQCSWYEFAGAIMTSAGAQTEIFPGRSEDLGRPATRPAYSVLRTERGPRVPLLPHWREGLAAYMHGRVPAA